MKREQMYLDDWFRNNTIWKLIDLSILHTINVEWETLESLSFQDLAENIRWKINHENTRCMKNNDSSEMFLTHYMTLLTS